MWNRNNKFEGWYFKHQLGDTVIAFIPGRAESGAFIQVISSWDSRMFTVPKLIVKGNIICMEAKKPGAVSHTRP